MESRTVYRWVILNGLKLTEGEDDDFVWNKDPEARSRRLVLVGVELKQGDRLQVITPPNPPYMNQFVETTLGTQDVFKRCVYQKWVIEGRDVHPCKNLISLAEWSKHWFDWGTCLRDGRYPRESADGDLCKKCAKRKLMELKKELGAEAREQSARLKEYKGALAWVMSSSNKMPAMRVLRTQYPNMPSELRESAKLISDHVDALKRDLKRLRKVKIKI